MFDRVHQHFRKEEHQFIDKILEYKSRVEDTYVDVVCHFLTPRQLKVASALFSKDDVVKWYESQLPTERKRAVISYNVPESDDFEEVILNIQYPSKFYQLKHSSILGAVLNLGVKREYIGDIVTDGEQWQMIVAKSIADLICRDLQRIGKASVKVVPTTILLDAVDTGELVETLVSSLRLDAMISEGFNVSRALSKTMVESGVVSLNWVVCEKSEVEVCEWDVISVRGYGRMTLQQIMGTTKKGKFKIILCKQVNRKK
ncbi:RNA-binding protein [Carnobacteriaceae bacterium zg-ZUI240]|nr:RNA-binding protein [Carnobacteriaceae bacterium zg-ZUI240]